MKNWIIKNKEIVIIIVLSFMVLILGIRMNSLKQDKKESDNTIYNLTAEVITYKLKDGRSASKIAAFEASNTKALMALNSKDSTIQELQKETKRYKKRIANGGGVIVVEGNTDISGTVPTIVLNSPKLTYKWSFSDEWVNLSGESRSDSTSFNLGVRNKYTVAIGHEREKFFSKAKPFAEVTNSNPYSETETVRAFITSKERKKRWGLGLQGGYGFGSEKLHGYIGAGISYNLIMW